VVNLKSTLEHASGSYGGTLTQNHIYFKGVNIRDANQKFQSKKIGEVLKEISGSDLNDAEKKQLEKFYNDFLS
jgi:hypothetical protein